MRRTSQSIATSSRRTSNESSGSSESNRSPVLVNVNFPWQSRRRCSWVTMYTTRVGAAGLTLPPSLRGVAADGRGPRNVAGGESRCVGSTAAIPAVSLDVRCWFSRCPSSATTMSAPTASNQPSRAAVSRRRRGRSVRRVVDPAEPASWRPSVRATETSGFIVSTNPSKWRTPPDLAARPTAWGSEICDKQWHLVWQHVSDMCMLAIGRG
jgi:hypothetical protein